MNRADPLPILGPIAVLSLFVVSCALPAGFYRGKFLEEGTTLPGYWLLATGWNPLLELAALAWFANPLLVVSLVYLWRRNYGKSAAWSGVGAALSVLPVVSVADIGPGELHIWPQLAWIFVREWDGSEVNRTDFRVGYFAWAGSHLLMFANAGICWYRSPSGRAPNAPTSPGPANSALVVLPG